MSMWKVQLDKMTKCSRNDTILFSAYPIHGSVIEENDEMSVIANTDMKLFTDPLAVRLRGATQLAADSQGTNTDLNRLSSLYLSNHVHTQLGHNSQGTNTVMEPARCLSTPGCTQLVHNSQGTNTDMELSVYPWVYSAGTGSPGVSHNSTPHHSPPVTSKMPQKCHVCPKWGTTI